MATAGDQINGALRLIGQLAEGETPSSETSADALTALNQMLDSWSAERLSVFSTQDQVFTWPAGVTSRTLGPTGDFVGLRPVALDTATYFKDTSTGLSFGVQLINEAQYNGIALKTVTSSYPELLWVNMSMPDITMYVYPVPTKALEWHFISVQVLAQAASLATVLSFPPGYLRAFKYNLACEIAAEFGIEPPTSVQRIAMVSKRDIKRQNNPDGVLSMPYVLMNNLPRYNIYAGNF